MSREDFASLLYKYIKDGFDKVDIETNNFIILFDMTKHLIDFEEETFTIEINQVKYAFFYEDIICLSI